MADYLDREASESEGEEDDDTPRVPHGSKKKLKAIESDDEEEDEDDQGDLEDLIDDRPIEDGSGSDTDNGSSKSRKRKKSDDEDDYSGLDEEDYDLLEQNTGVRIKRQQRKRVKEIHDEDSDQEDAPEAAKEKIARQIFVGGSDAEDEQEAVSEGEERRRDDSEEDSDGMTDFLVDDEGRPITERNRKKSKRIFNDATLQEAQDIFGVDFDYGEFEGADEEEEDDEDEEYEDEEGERKKRQGRKKRKEKSVYELYEPSELERAGLTEEDNKIRNNDIPERMQLRSVPVTPATQEELEEEAQWIYDLIFSKRRPDDAQETTADASKSPRKSDDDLWDAWGSAAASKDKPSEDDWGIPKPTGTNDEEWNDSATAASAPVAPVPGIATLSAEEKRKEKYLPKIYQTLDHIRNQLLEVPFINFYRKERVLPELRISNLWEIYRADAKFCQLKTRKQRLLQLFENILAYQTEIICRNPDDDINPNMRIVTPEDLERIKAIKTSEELKDVYMQFTLYYSELVVPMKTWLSERRKEQRRIDKEKARAARGNDESEEDRVVDDDIDDNMDEDDEQSAAIKRKMGGGAYSLCQKMGILGLTKLFGLTPEKFAENVKDNYGRHDVEQIGVDPEEAAKDYVCPKLKTPDEVLRAAKFMVATQLSREPLFRQSVREVFFENATLTVRPTKKGIKEIDENHPVYTMKYLVDKPVRDLKDDEFLRLTIAEEDKFLTIAIGAKIKALSSNSDYVDEVKKLYHLDEFTAHVQAWNDVRAECVEVAMEKYLYPILRKELRAKLAEDAKEYVLKICATSLFDKIKTAPYKLDSSTISPDEQEEMGVSKGLQVLALAYVPDFTQASFACHVGPDGEPTDYLRLQNITKNKNSFRESDKQEKEADLQVLKTFIRQKQPHVIVIGGESRDAIYLKKDIEQLIDELGLESGYPKIAVEIMDNQLAKVYSNSIKASTDFREYPLLLKQAVSLGRLIQDPLIEYAQLCTPDDEILCMRFHKLQDHVPKEELLEWLHYEFINRVNEVGVDINRALANPYTASLVQFVCGLGVRKATALLKTLKQTSQRLENRTQLITTCHMGPRIFINCSGFIKIDTNSLGDSTEAYVEVLDGSRVHPETYEWARKMAVDALEYEDEADPNPAGAVEEILEQPEKLQDLDLSKFAAELEKNGFGPREICLNDICMELNDRYADRREAFKPAGAEELFFMLTKETKETMRIGKLITSQVLGVSHRKPKKEELDNAAPEKENETGMWRCAFCGQNDFVELSDVWNHFDAGGCPGAPTGVRIRLDNGISGFIPVLKLSDKKVVNPDQRVRRGQTIHCRVTKVEVEKFAVECTSRTSDLLDLSNEYKPKKDDYYNFEAEQSDMRKEQDVRKLKHKQTYIKRVIVHPSFKNISFRECEKLMEQVEPGEVIIRPSSKGANHLTVTWKVAPGVLQHIDVREEGKENEFSLGKSLWIGKEPFEDLDEIIARHINPMVAYCRDILNYKYHSLAFNGSREKAEEYLLDEKKKNPSKIHYMLHPAKEFPGKFYLSYLPRIKVTHELVSVTPDGLRYRQQYHDGLTVLLKWFKEHYRDPPPTATPVLVTPRTANATRTPYETPHHADALSRVGGPAASRYGAPSVVGATPNFATPAQNFTPYSQYGTSHNTPYTPTAQTPYMTPYASTPFQGQATPRFGASGTSASVVGTSDQRRMKPPSKSVHGRPTNESDDWRRVAEAWANASTKPALPPVPSSRFGGSVAPGPSSTRMPPKSPAARNAAQVITDGINRTRQLNSSALNYLPNSPRSGRESLRSTPRTNFSPRSMVESSIGDGTPLYDEN